MIRTHLHRPLINRLKYFRIWYKFRRDIRIFQKLCGVHHTAESSSAVCIALRSQTAHWGVKIEIFKGTIRRNPFRGEHICHERKDLKKKNFYLLSLKFWLSSVMHTAESNFSNFVIEYLCEIVTEFENTLACLARWVRIMKKSGGRKSRDTVISSNTVCTDLKKSFRNHLTTEIVLQIHIFWLIISMVLCAVFHYLNKNRLKY